MQLQTVGLPQVMLCYDVTVGPSMFFLKLLSVLQIL